MREIRKYKKSSDLLIPAMSFSQSIQKVAMSVLGSNEPKFCFKLDAIKAPQEATEGFLVDLFKDTLLCAIHVKRDIFVNLL